MDEAAVVLPPEPELLASIDASMAAGPFNSTAWCGLRQHARWLYGG